MPNGPGVGSSVQRRAKRAYLHWIQNGRCMWCDGVIALVDSTLDELIPRGRGGTSAWGNIVMACRPCNTARGHTAPPAWALRRAQSMAVIKTAAFQAERVLADLYTPLQNTTQEKT